MTNHKMMDEVICYCTKCKLELNHRIIRLEAGHPKRVLCLTCHTERSYRKSAPAKTDEGKVRKQRVPASKGDQESEWRAKLDRGNKSPKPYAMDKPFLLDDRIEHHLFGVGLVVSLIHPNKI